MKLVTRRTLAIVGGLLITFGALYWAFIGAGIAAELLQHRHDVASVIGPDAIYKNFGDVYIVFGIFGLCAASGLSFMLVLWDRRPPQRRIVTIYFVLLILVLPLSVLNYWSADIFVSRHRQALIDVILVFLGLVTATHLFHLQARSVTARVIQAMVLFFLVFQAVIVPAIFATLWLLNWEGAITAAQSRDFTPSWVSIVATVGSLAISTLRYFYAPSAHASGSKSIIINSR